jgi:glutamate synthase (NADPH/NADH) large chain
MRNGLYTPGEFKDNCGFGLISQMEGKASHELLTTAIESLTCMTHRGGIAADGKTGDGCGLLIQKPDNFLRTVVKESLGETLPEQYAVGMVFLDLDESIAALQRKAFNKAVTDEGLNVVGWRVVPTNNDCLGPMAVDCLPQFEQIFITAGETALSQQELAIKLFYARRQTEIALTGHENFYICSLAETVLSYKGLMMPVDLPAFYTDLGD